MVAKGFYGREQTIIKIMVLDQAELFKTRGVVLQQMRDYLNNLPYFKLYTKVGIILIVYIHINSK